MPTEQKLRTAWREVVQTQANCDRAIADKQWGEASHWAYELKRAACELERAIDAHAPIGIASPSRPQTGEPSKG